MTLFGYRLGIRFFTLFGLLALGAFIFGVDPEDLRAEGLFLFFLSFWVTASGIASLLFLTLYEKVMGEMSTVYNIGGVLRQGALLGSFSLSVFILLFFSLFAWWSVALSLTFFLLVEYTARKFFS